MKLYEKLEQVRTFVNECETQDKKFYLNALDTAIKKLKVKTESRIPDTADLDWRDFHGK